MKFPVVSGTSSSRLPELIQPGREMRERRDMVEAAIGERSPVKPPCQSEFGLPRSSRGPRSRRARTAEARRCVHRGRADDPDEDRREDRGEHQVAEGTLQRVDERRGALDPSASMSAPIKGDRPGPNTTSWIRMSVARRVEAIAASAVATATPASAVPRRPLARTRTAPACGERRRAITRRPRAPRSPRRRSRDRPTPGGRRCSPAGRRREAPAGPVRRA